MAKFEVGERVRHIKTGAQMEVEQVHAPGNVEPSYLFDDLWIGESLLESTEPVKAKGLDPVKTPVKTG
jgi:hypothetical protein